MEKEEMEEELGEKIEALQRELGQARAGAGDARQVDELKKVLGAEGQVGAMGACLTCPRGPLCFQAPSCLLSRNSSQHTLSDPAGLLSLSLEVSRGKGSQ